MLRMSPNRRIEEKPSPLGHLAYAILCSLVLLILAADPALSIDVDMVLASPQPGSTVTFTINVTNTGQTPLDPVMVTDRLPPAMSYSSDDRGGRANGSEIVWDNLGPLGVGEWTMINLETIISPRAEGTLENTVEATGVPPTGYNVTDSDSEEILIEPFMRETGSAGGKNVALGDQFARAYLGTASNKVTIISN